MKDKLPIVTIMGPTGVGKTDLAISLNKTLPSEIISVDSVQVYKKMNIGSGKPLKSILKKYPHKLVDIIEPWENYSLALFIEDSKREIQNCRGSNQIPLLVGGTKLYLKSLLSGISRMPKANLKVREKIMCEAQEIGWPLLHDRLTSIDPESASKIHPNDIHRIQRALEVYEISSKTMTELKKEHKSNSLLNENKVLQFAIKPESREILRQKIRERFLKMLDFGLVKEVETILTLEEMDTDKVSMKSAGYRQVCDYLENKISYEEMVYRAVNATRQLAKRQMTWLRSWQNVIWVTQDIDDSAEKIKRRIEA